MITVRMREYLGLKTSIEVVFKEQAMLRAERNTHATVFDNSKRT